MNEIFSSQQKQNLITAFVRSRTEGATEAQIVAFVEACEKAKIEAACVDLLADGQIAVEWSPEKGFIWSMMGSLEP